MSRLRWRAPGSSPYDFKAISAATILDAPSAAHWLGTDQLGRDVLTRTAMGGRQAIVVTAIATPLAVAWGGILGIWLGLAGGRLDDVLMRVVDAFLSLPWILKMLLIIVTFGAGIGVLVPTLAFFYGVPVIRIARAATHGVVARDYVLAARARGHGRGAIILREILPNALPPVIAVGSLMVATAILTESSLSFLGLADPNLISWGYIIGSSRPVFREAWWLSVLPGLCLFVTVLAINLLADGLGDAGNPLLRPRRGTST